MHLRLVHPWRRSDKNLRRRVISFILKPKRPSVRHAVPSQVLSMISSSTVEREIRGDFVLRCNISSEKARADEICASSEAGLLNPAPNLAPEMSVGRETTVWKRRHIDAVDIKYGRRYVAKQASTPPIRPTSKRFNPLSKPISATGFLPPRKRTVHSRQRRPIHERIYPGSSSPFLRVLECFNDWGGAGIRRFRPREGHHNNPFRG